MSSKSKSGQQFHNGYHCTPDQRKAQADTTRQILAYKYKDMKVVCSPKRYPTTVQALPSAHQDAIANTVFRGMLHTRPITLRRIMLVEIALSFNVEKEVFDLCGAEIPMIPSDVYHIMGIPVDGEEISLDSQTSVNNDLFLSYKSQAPGNNHITLKSLEQSIRNSKVPDDHFIRQFVLYTIGFILAPTTKDYVDANWRSKLISKAIWPCYNKHAVSYSSVPRPLMQRWDEKNAKLRSDAYELDNIDGGVVVMTLSTQNAPSKTTVHKTTKTSPEGSHQHEKRVHLQHSIDSSMTNQQMDMILQAITKNRLAMGRTILQVEHNLCSKILTLEEHLAENRIDRGVHTRLCSVEDGINDIRRDMQEISSALHSNKTSPLQGHQFEQEAACPDMTKNFTNSHSTFPTTPSIFGLDSFKNKKIQTQSGIDQEATAKKPTFSSQQSGVNTSSPEPSHVLEQLSNLQEMEGLGGDMSLLASKPLLRKTSGRDQEATAKKPTFSSQQSGVTTSSPEPSHEPEQLINIQEMEGLGGDMSLLASKPLLRKTGGRDIYDQQSLQYLYTNDKHKNMSIEDLGFDNDYTLSEEDKEALHFIEHSYEYAPVVDIAGIILTVKFLKPHITDGWLYDTVIDAYAYIANMDNSLTSVITTVQSLELAGQLGEFDPKRERKWIGSIGQRCATRLMVFVPFNVCGCHWSLLVVNKQRKEIQILNSLANIPQFRDEKMETTLVKNLQACVDYAVEAGFMSLIEDFDLTQWGKHYYTNIPQQNDCNSCGVYVLKSMLEWNGVEMRQDFRPDQMKIFRRKICCRLLRSDSNKSRRQSYKEPLTKQQFLVESPPYHPKSGVGLDDDVHIYTPKNSTTKNQTTSRSSKKEQGKQSECQKKRGRPKKDAETTNAVSTEEVSQKSLKTATTHEPTENRRVRNPSQYHLSPFKQL